MGQSGHISDTALTGTGGEQTDLDRRLIQPASVLGRVVDREPVPQPTSGLLSETLHQRLAGMRTQVVQHQMDGIGLRIVPGDVQQIIVKLGRAERSGVTLIKCRPAFGCTPEKALAVPQRLCS